MEEVKIGQVWRTKANNGAAKICIIGVSRANMVFICGFVDVVDPEITRQYLWENYDLDHNYV